jgi:putative tryptophan/tyrosine transport system substrate-binding protein
MRRREFIAGLGSATVWPVVANTQQLARPTIGYLSGATETANSKLTAAFRQGLREQGYAEGRDVEIIYRWSSQRYDQLPAMAADLVRRRVNLIVTTAGNAPALAAKSATSSIPIVFQLGGDPVELGLVASLSRPGGNLTGAVFLTQELTAKRLELLHEIAPSASTIGYLINPTNPGWDARMRAAEIAARALNLRLVVEKSSTASEIEAAYPILVAQQIGALMVDSDPLFFGQRAQLAALSVRHKLPAIYHARESVEAGGLMSYGANIAEAYHLAGSYAGRILKGEKPAELPVQQSTKIELVINLSTGKALGQTIPPILLGRADEVIE